MDNLPVPVDYKNQTNWKEDSKKLLKQDLNLREADIEGIERILGTGVENSVDETRETKLPEDTNAKVFTPKGIVDAGESPVVLEYEKKIGMGELASMITYSKMMKIDQELKNNDAMDREGAFPRDDDYFKKLYTQFVTTIPKEYIDGLEITTKERSRLDVARKNYLSKLSDAIDMGSSEAPGNKNIHMQLQRARKEISDPVFMDRFENAAKSYQEQREQVLTKIAAKEYRRNQQGKLDIAKLMHPTREVYNSSKKFLNRMEKRTHNPHTDETH